MRVRKRSPERAAPEMGRVTKLPRWQSVRMPPSPDRLAKPDEEARLVERSRQGDAVAFTQLVAAHQGRVRAYVGGTVHRPEVVDDLAQEVFLDAFRKLGSYKGEAPFGLWLLGIARHKALMHLRQEVRRLARERRSLDFVLSELRVRDLEADEARIPQRERESAALQTCLERLPSGGAELIADRYFQRRSIGEIAAARGKREGTMRMNLLRLRQLLRDCVEQRLAREDR
jgi:RNA polymerase sigma-70 factor (ECF subfamily)